MRNDNENILYRGILEAQRAKQSDRILAMLDKARQSQGQNSEGASRLPEAFNLEAEARSPTTIGTPELTNHVAHLDHICDPDSTTNVALNVPSNEWDRVRWLMTIVPGFERDRLRAYELADDLEAIYKRAYQNAPEDTEEGRHRNAAQIVSDEIRLCQAEFQAREKDRISAEAEKKVGKLVKVGAIVMTIGTAIAKAFTPD